MKKLAWYKVIGLGILLGIVGICADIAGIPDWAFWTGLFVLAIVWGLSYRMRKLENEISELKGKRKSK